MQTAKKYNFRRSLDSVKQFDCAIGENTTITGQFSGSENILVRGTVKGSSDIRGAIVVLDKGCWIGQTVADVIVIAGRVEGDVEAREKVEILAGGHVLGDIHAPVVAMETGAIHEGRIHMPAKAQLNRFMERRLDSLSLAT